MDILFINQLTVMTIIGIYDWEQKHLQKLIFDLEIGWDNKLAARYNCIKNCLNYNEVVDFILSFTKNKRFSLIEKVAEDIARKLIVQFKLSWIRIKVSKPNAVRQAKNVGVIIERSFKEI